MSQTPAQPAHPAVPVHTFTQRFSSTPLGARLARHLAVHQLDGWGVPRGTAAADAAEAVVAELAANAVTHGRVPGRDFEVRLEVWERAPGERTLRIAVSDTRTDRRPAGPDAVTVPAPLAGSGRGLPLVAAFAGRWTVRDRLPGPGKTVVAELDLP
jgi:anti-sigma regulatory factor (Ser/Thr protein kinase)